MSTTVADHLWVGGMPKQLPPSRIYFTRRKLQYAFETAGVQPGAKILEIGCTVGNYTFPIQKLGYDVTGFDIDEEAIGIARTYAREQGLEHIRFELGNAQQMSQLADESFDHVFSFQAFRYFSDLGAALREVHRVLRPGGVSVIDYPNRYSPFYSIYKRVKGHRYDFADYNYLSGADAEDHYRRAGFKEVSSELMLFSPPTTPTPLLPIMKGIDAVLESIPGVSSLAGFLMVRGEK